MKKIFLFLLIPVFLFSCKVKEKKTASQVAENKAVEVLKQTDRPHVNTVEGKYNFVDSLSARVFLRLNISKKGELMSLEDLNQAFSVQWILQTDFGIREKLKSGKLAFIPELASTDGQYQYLIFEIPRLREYSGAILLVEFVHPQSGTKFNFDIAIDFNATRSNTRFEIYNPNDLKIPRFHAYVHTNEPVVIKSIQQGGEPLQLIRYTNYSKPALSPMSGNKRDPMSEFDIMESMEVKDGQTITLTEPGMYVLTQDVGKLSDGYGFLVTDSRYPRMANPNVLKEAVAYMSTSKEIEGFSDYDSAKDGLDMYFLKLAGGNEELAKKIIRNYFKRIEEANEIFTTYKEGWKTDRGMVYTIMGPPSQVQRNRTREVWTYSKKKNTSEVIYTFYRRPNIFTDQNYELVRYPEYSAFWFPYVEEWRTGKVGE